MKRKSTLLMMLMVFVLMFSLTSCEEEFVWEPLREGLYYDGSILNYLRLLEVDEFGEYHYFYPEIGELEIVGFASHDGKATSPWETVDAEYAVIHYLFGINEPAELYRGMYGRYYIVHEEATKDWLALYDEMDKYVDSVELEAACECGTISFTYPGEENIANPAFIKSVRVIPHPFSGEDYADWLKVENKSLRLTKKYTLPKGFTTEVLIELENGYAKEELYFVLTVKGTDDL